MAASLTSSGVTFSTGNSLSDAPWYTGSTATNTSFPIGSYIMTGSTNYCGSTGGYNLNNSKAVWVASGGAYGHSGRVFTNSGTSNGNLTTTAISGTWVVRGCSNSNIVCGSPVFDSANLLQRTA